MHQLTRILFVVALLPVPTIATADDSPAESTTETTEPETSEAVPEFQATEVETRILGFLDLNGDGSLEPGEFERFPAPMAAWMKANETATDKPVAREGFAPTLRRMMADLRAGRHSTPYRGSSLVRRDSPTAGRPVEEPEVPQVDTSGPIGVEAGYAFGRMDQNPRDGILSLEEWNGQTKEWFEENKVAIPREMDKDTFMQHYVRLRK